MRRPGQIGASLAILLTGLLFGPAASADTLRIACDENFPPYNFIEQGEVVGLDAEIVAAIAGQAGDTVQFEPHPWSRVQQLLERGEIDAAFQFVGRPDRFERYFMIGPHRIGRTVFAARPESTAGYRALEDLRGLRIGVIRGYTYGAGFDDAAFLTKDAGAGDNRQLVRMLAAGRVDLIIGDSATLSYFARLDALNMEMKLLPRALDEVPRYIAVPRSRPAVAARLERGLQQLRGNGGLVAILQKWE